MRERYHCGDIFPALPNDLACLGVAGHDGPHNDGRTFWESEESLRRRTFVERAQREAQERAAADARIVALGGRPPARPAGASSATARSGAPAFGGDDDPRAPALRRRPPRRRHDLRPPDRLRDLPPLPGALPVRAGRRPAGEPVTAPILTVAEAFEAAIARGDLPLHWGDPARAPLWWCPACQGTGRRHAPGVTLPAPCFACWDGVGHTASPPDLPTLAAVAAFGADRLVTVERLYDVAFPGARIVWRADDLTPLLPAWERDRGSPGPMGELMRLGAWPVGGGNSGPVHLVVHRTEEGAISS